MRHFNSLDQVSLQHTWLTIGSFDGVHLGHREIIQNLVSKAHEMGALAVVLTFHPHPAIVLKKRNDPFYLTTPQEKASLLGDLGVDVVITQPFDPSLASTSAANFMAILKNRLDIEHLLVGRDFALGQDRRGNISRLRQLGQEYGYTIEIFPPVEIEGQVVSSSKIRAALRDGDVLLAARFLGRPYRIIGKVINGDGRGRKIGIPTANLEVWPERAIPKSGVYVCQATLNQQPVGAVTNVGFRPTFENQPLKPTVEAHLLDFDGDLYGEEISLDFLLRLRDEQRFPSVQALVKQIQQDIARSRETLMSCIT